MSILSNRYGYTGTYGTGTYKGSTSEGTPGVLRGISFSSNRKCFHFGFDQEQGLGWSEDTDTNSYGDMPWPEAQAAIVHMYDEYAQPLLVIFDEGSGLPYFINTREGPSGSKVTKRWKDKVDPNTSGSGTHITWDVTQGEVTGEEMDFTIENDEQRIHVRPIKASNRSATGYDSDTGLPDGLEITSSFYTDGDVTAETTIEDIPTDSEYVFDYDARAHALQQKLSFNRAALNLQRIESKYKVIDQPLIPGKGNTTEAGYELELAAPSLWLSRGSSLLLDRASGSTLSGSATATTGPDSKSNSAMILASSLALGNSAYATGMMLIWSTNSSLTITGLTLTEVSNNGTWYLYYADDGSGAIPASLTLPAGTYCDVRIYSSTISSSARSDYYTDVISHYGEKYMPRW